MIDAHHHFWKYSAAEYGWIDESMQALRRDFLPAHLADEIHAAGIDGVVTVQARQSLAETDWLLSLAAEHDFVRGVVGWLPLAEDGLRDCCERYADHQKFRAVRHVIQDEPDDCFMLREGFNAGVAALAEFGLVYDLLILEHHLPFAAKFVDRHPQQVFVLDHIAKPRIRNGVIEPWQTHVRELARRDHVYCKVSGMVTEADARRWTVQDLQPYWDVVVDAFGPHRLMFGSDWPVCLVACSYGRWHAVVKQLAADLSVSERARLLGETAVEVYQLGSEGGTRP